MTAASPAVAVVPAGPNKVPFLARLPGLFTLARDGVARRDYMVCVSCPDRVPCLTLQLIRPFAIDSACPEAEGKKPALFCIQPSTSPLLYATRQQHKKGRQAALRRQDAVFCAYGHAAHLHRQLGPPPSCPLAAVVVAAASKQLSSVVSRQAVGLFAASNPVLAHPAAKVPIRFAPGSRQPAAATPRGQAGRPAPQLSAECS